MPDRRPRHWSIGAAIVGLLLIVAVWGVWRASSRPAPIVIAFAASPTGGGAAFGHEGLVATQILLDDANAAGGVGKRPVVLQVFDDQSKPAVAKEIVAAVLDSPAVAVLGHTLNATSVAAGPGYKAGRIPAVAGNASADEMTQDNPYYFRAQSANTVQGGFLADYMRTIVLDQQSLFMKRPDVYLISGDDPYGRSFRNGFTSRDGLTSKVLMMQIGGKMERHAADIAEQLAREPEPRIIIGVVPDIITPLLRAIRKRGIRSMAIMASGAADDSFAAQFAREPEELDSPGFFTDNSFAIAPLILDSTGALGQQLAVSYRARTGKRAGWIAAGAQDSARRLVAALRRATFGGTLAIDRDAVRTALAGINGPDAVVNGINGRLFFNSRREMPRALRYGFFYQGQFLSAPLQLVRVQDPDLVDIDHETELGHIATATRPGPVGRGRHG